MVDLPEPTFLRRALDLALEAAHRGQREVLLESEALGIVEALGIPTPRRAVFREAGHVEAGALALLGSERAVVKVLSPAILHKSDVGGVDIVPNDVHAVAHAIRAMQQRLGDAPIEGFAVNEFLDYDRSLGGELLLGVRWTPEFGPVVTVGIGGIYTEFLSANLKPGRDVAILSPSLTPRARILDRLAGKSFLPLATGGLRGQAPRVAADRLVPVIAALLDFAGEFVPDPFAEFEINPLALADGRPVALDALARLSREEEHPRPAAPRPLGKLKNLLEPRSAAVIGVSRKLNPGHIIVNNLLREGFPPQSLHVVKPGLESFEGCPCVPDISSLREPVDLLIVCVDASQVPAVVDEVVRTRRAEGVILVPGGLGERAGTEQRVLAMQERLAEARGTGWRGPLLNGGNCLGIRSRPGRYDTLFIPERKMPDPSGAVAPVALISQSGAFMVARASKLDRLNPRYLISIGNQIDLTMGDYLAYLKDDKEIVVYACYAEGFRPLDGRAFLEAAKAITDSGRTVLLYRAGRTPEGRHATASHTASIAGDYTVTRELAEAAGVVVVDQLGDFEDLVRLFTWLRGQRVDGLRLGALTNAGFESVAFADNLGPFELAGFAPRTMRRVASVLERCRLEAIVTPRNPLDVTPIMDDAAYEEVMRAVLDDEATDVSVLGCVPLSGALQTLPAGHGVGEGVEAHDSVARRLARLKREGGRAFVAVIDAGRPYDRMAAILEEAEVPTFRSAERALRLFATFCRARLLQEA